MLRLIKLGLALVFLLSLNQAAWSQSGQPPKPSAGSAETGVPADLEWRELSETERDQAMQLLIAQTGSNYEKISTWAGTYSVHQEEYWPESSMRGPFASEGKPARAVIHESEATFRFVIDVQSNSVFRERDTVRHRMLSADGARTPIKLGSEYGPIDQRSVVTAKEYLYYQYKSGMTTLGLVGTFPEAQDRRWAYRVPLERTRGGERGDLMNPLFFFHCNSKEPFHQYVGTDLAMLRGEKGSKVKAEMRAGLKMSESSRDGGVWYRIQKRVGRTGPQAIFTSIWSQAAGFNPVSSSVAYEVDGKSEIQGLMDWRWRKVDEIFVPAYVKEATYSKYYGGINTYLRIAELKECRLNKPIPPETFTIKALGLEDGELLADETNQTVYVVDGDGGTTRLARFNEVYVPPDKRRTAAIRWTLFLGALVLLLAAGGLSVYRRMGRSRGDHPATVAS